MTWELKTWQDVCSLHYGKPLKDYKHFNDPFPVYGSGGVVGSTKNSIVPSQSVIVSRKGTLTAYWSTEASHVIDTAFWLEPKEDIEPRWAYYAVKNLDISTLSSGSGVPSLSRDDFYREDIALPPLAEQKAIANVLGMLDDKINLNQKLSRKLEGVAKAIFKSWFVNFDPVRAKMEGSPTGLLPEIGDLFPDKMVASEIGQIPQGWGVSTIADLADCVGGATPSTKNSDFWEGGNLAWTSPKDLSGAKSTHLMRTDKKITPSGLKRISSGLLPCGTVLLSSRAPVGYLALTTEPTAINQGYIALKQKVGVSNFFLLNWCEANIEEIKNRASGTTFAEISKGAFRPIPAISPSTQIMSVFHYTVYPLYERTLTASKESDTLKELRDILLPKLISGKLRIPDAEKILKGAGI